MMQTFRNNMKIIFYIIIFFFVGWMAVTLTGLDEYLTQQSQEEMLGMKYAGEVAGEKIDRNSYEMRVQNTVNMASGQRASGSLSAWEIDQITDQVWGEMVNDIVLGEAYDRRSIGVLNSEIIEYIRGNPIQELRESPQLLTDGRFDFDKYLALLANPAAANLVMELERDARQKIPSLKLFLEVGSIGKLTDSELERAFRSVQEKVSVAYIEFNPDSIVGDDEVTVSEEDVAAYYEEHKDEYQRPEIARLEYILLPLIPGAEDSVEALDTLAVVAAKLADGEQWDTLAARYSQGPLAASGGDLGWFSRGDYTDEEMVKLAFSLKAGKISAPTLTASGYQIVRTDSVRTQDGVRQVKAKRILIEAQAGRKTMRNARARIRNLRKLMSKSAATFAAVATDSGFVVSQTGEFAVGNQIPGLQVTREILDFIYSAKEDQLSYPITVIAQGSSSGEMVMLARVITRKKKGQILLSEAALSIRQLLTQEAKVEMASARIEPLLAGYEGFENLTAFATDKGLAVDTSGMFSRASGLTGMGSNNEFVGTAFGLPVGVKSSLVKTEFMYYLLEPVEREDADLSQLEENRERLVNQLVSSRMQAFFSLFSSELMESMEVKDFRRMSSPDDTTANQAMAEEAQN
jgi:peptidyl-prolyl cis-trans isomerase D